MSEKHEHYGHRKRLRHRVATEGMDNFLDYQVIEYALSFVIPYKDTNPIAHRLINRFGSLSGVFEADVEEIMKVDGMGEASAHYIASFLKIYNCYQKDRAKEVDCIFNTTDAYNYLKKFLQNKQKEEIYIVCLSPKNKIVKCEKLAIGTTNEAQIAIRSITDIVSKNKVNTIVMAHNHPSGRPEPSEDDNVFTKTLVTALAFNSTKLLDHLIITNDGYYSYWKSGLLQEYNTSIQSLFKIKPLAQSFPKYEVGDD